MADRLLSIVFAIAALIALAIGAFILWFFVIAGDGESTYDSFFFGLGFFFCGLSLGASSVQLLRHQRDSGMSAAQLAVLFLTIGILVPFVISPVVAKY